MLESKRDGNIAKDREIQGESNMRSTAKGQEKGQKLVASVGFK